jgi:hypothetical protein
MTSIASLLEGSPSKLKENDSKHMLYNKNTQPDVD